MELQRLVTGAKLGRHDDFAALVRLYQHRLLATVKGLVRDPELAEDLVQEAFVRAWSSLEALRTAEAFPAWLWSIARNLARSQGKTLAREDEHRGIGEPDDYPDPRSLSLVGDGVVLPRWAQIAGTMGPDQRTLLELRYGVGLTLRQIGAVLGIPEQRVKSRLFTARQKLEKSLGQNLLRDPQPFLEEKIMDKIQTLRLGAHVFERLSLAAQAEFALVVLRDGPLPESVLAEVGRVDRGPEFLVLYGTSLKLPELIGILNLVDRFTEGRLIEHLEVVSPGEAEQLKRNFFVFEDILCFDPSALRLLFGTADRDLFVLALAGTELKVRHHVYQALDPQDRSDLETRVGKADGDRKLVRVAQELVVHRIKELEQAGRLVVGHEGGSPEGAIFFTAS